MHHFQVSKIRNFAILLHLVCCWDHGWIVHRSEITQSNVVTHSNSPIKMNNRLGNLLPTIQLTNVHLSTIFPAAADKFRGIGNITSGTISHHRPPRDVVDESVCEYAYHVVGVRVEVTTKNSALRRCGFSARSDISDSVPVVSMTQAVWPKRVERNPPLYTLW